MLVVILFLQTWRAAIIPIVAIPGFADRHLLRDVDVRLYVEQSVAVRAGAGDRHRRRRRDRRGGERRTQHRGGLSPREAAIKSMDEVGAALIAIALVLSAVFVPSAFITGISGQFYRQFALTIAGATDHFAGRLADAVACAVRAAAQAARAKHERERWWDKPIHGFFRAIQSWLRQAATWLRLAFRQGRALRRADAGRLCRRHRFRPQRIPQDAGRLHPAARPRLS